MKWEVDQGTKVFKFETSLILERHTPKTPN